MMNDLFLSLDTVLAEIKHCPNFPFSSRSFDFRTQSMLWETF